MSWMWLIAIVLVLAAGGGIFFAVQNPAYLYGFGKAFLRDLIRASIPLFRSSPKTPEEWKIIRNKLRDKERELNNSHSN